MAFQQFPQKGGIPSGNTATRPANPVIGDTYYDGTVGFLLIWDGTAFIPCSAPAAQPTIAVTDVGTSVAYGTVQGSVAFTEGTIGGKAVGFTAVQGTTTQSSTSSPIVLTITGNPGSYSFSGTAYNAFGTSPTSPSVAQTLTSVPQTITTLTATSPTTNGATLSWTAPATGGKAISGYTLNVYSGTSTSLVTSTTTTSTTVVVTGLTAGGYNAKVLATNANGNSILSDSVSFGTIFELEYLVVAGGGGGGSANNQNSTAGGGGAGGYRTNIGGTPLSLSGGTTYNIEIGAGGTGGVFGTPKGTNGGNSRFHTIYSSGGGAGGGPEATNGNNGGSGGGKGHGAGTPGSGNAGGYSPVEGYAGGNGSNDGAAGGGGASAAAADATSQFTNGSGGAGSNSVSSWATITSSGVSGFFAGGGGGGSYNASNNTGTGGAGGGGDGKSRAGTGGAGTSNTGGGGGASGGSTGSQGTGGGNGGSGIVIIKYLSSFTPTFSGLTATTTTSSGFKYSAVTAGTGTVVFS